MTYIDGFLIPVPTAKREEYRAHEARWWPFFQERGARSMVVAWGDDIPAGERTDFIRAVQATDEETVVIAWMTWPDKTTRDAAYAAAMAEMPEDVDMPFDGARMVFGGFVPLLVEGTPPAE